MFPLDTNVVCELRKIRSGPLETYLEPWFTDYLTAIAHAKGWGHLDITEDFVDAAELSALAQASAKFPTAWPYSLSLAPAAANSSRQILRSNCAIGGSRANAKQVSAWPNLSNTQPTKVPGSAT